MENESVWSRPDNPCMQGNTKATSPGSWGPFAVDFEVQNNESLRIYLLPDAAWCMNLKIQGTTEPGSCPQDIQSLVGKKDKNTMYGI